MSRAGTRVDRGAQSPLCGSGESDPGIGRLAVARNAAAAAARTVEWAVALRSGDSGVRGGLGTRGASGSVGAAGERAGRLHSVAEGDSIAGAPCGRMHRRQSMGQDERWRRLG
jgi:hypothetical protein